MEQFWIVNLLAVFLLCVFFSGVLIPKILLIAYRKNLFDEPDERKIHKNAIPRLGGIAFTLVIFFSLALLMGLNLYISNGTVFSCEEGDIKTLCFALCSIMLLYIVGIADDLVGVQYRAKFLIQIVSGIMIIMGGLWFREMNGFMWLHEIPVWFGYPLTIFMIVFVINAINLIDGIDGLASGLCLVAFITYGIAFIYMGEYLFGAFALANLGVLLPFYYYNVFGNPEKHKKIFMGDTGSLTIGISLCILSLKLAENDFSTLPAAPNMFVVAFSPLIIPCFDVVRVYMHRVRNGKNPFMPDKNHIHHKLLALGIKQRTAMVLIIAISLLLVLTNCLASMCVNVNILLLVDVLFVTFGNVWLSRRIKSKKQK